MTRSNDYDPYDSDSSSDDNSRSSSPGDDDTQHPPPKDDDHRDDDRHHKPPDEHQVEGDEPPNDENEEDDDPPPLESRFVCVPYPFWDNPNEIDVHAYRFKHGERYEIENATEDNLPEHVQLHSFKGLIGGLTNGVRSRPLWLNDEIINAYMGLLTKKDSIENPNDRSFMFDHHFWYYLNETIRGYDYEGVNNWHTRFPNVDIFNTLRYMQIPINLNNQHWAKVFVFFRKGDNVIGYANSLGMDGKQIMKIILRYLEDYAKQHGLPFNKAEWSFKNLRKRAPQQNNFNDCGVYVCLNAYLIFNNIPLLYSQRSVDACESRKIIALSLLRGEALCPISISRGKRPAPNLRQTEQSQHEAVKNPSSQNKTNKKSKTSFTNEAEQKTDSSRYTQRVDSTTYCAYPIAEYESFTPDYIRCEGFVRACFGKDVVPTDLVGYGLLSLRADKARERLKNEHCVGTAKKVIQKKENNAYFSYRDLCKFAEKTSVQTNEIKVNHNGTSDDKPTLPTNRKYEGKPCRKCAFVGCCNATTSGLAFERLPKAPPF